MKRLLASACLICTALSGCAGLNYRHGVGFTGIDGEPKVPTVQSDRTVSRAAGPIAELAARTPQRLQVASGDPAVLAETAIHNGGQTMANAIPATLGGAQMMLSTVEVNGVPHAVLRLPEGQRMRLSDGSGAGFADAVPRLTGCLAAGPAYRRDRPALEAGLAVPLNCR
ncbi:hypothetical protein [Antarcticimicrobium sediminis]|uniref:Uncharacterized protein n=1 Tax=Antarcticimicrobium sediminis TaxID=2546227 RepID=A0A4R5EHL4_9RHOB|nr:hypothetical protein [Antarcticimicrobium sediminis]TDE33824.1 hypothetical protein E1B25_20715 [Antarcticimicrobium sediminis]